MPVVVVVRVGVVPNAIAVVIGPFRWIERKSIFGIDDAIVIVVIVDAIGTVVAVEIRGEMLRVERV